MELRQRKALEPEGASTEAVVVEVRIEGKSASAYGPSFDRYNVDQPCKTSSKRLGRRSGGGMVRPVYRPALVILSEEGSEVVARLRFESCGPRPLGRPGALGHPSSKLPLRKQILQQAVIRPAHCLEELFSRAAGANVFAHENYPLSVAGSECKGVLVRPLRRLLSTFVIAV